MGAIDRLSGWPGLKRIEVEAPRLRKQGDQLETTPGVDNLAQ